MRRKLEPQVDVAWPGLQNAYLVWAASVHIGREKTWKHAFSSVHARTKIEFAIDAGRDMQNKCNAHVCRVRIDRASAWGRDETVAICRHFRLRGKVPPRGDFPTQSRDRSCSGHPAAPRASTRSTGTGHAVIASGGEPDRDFSEIRIRASVFKFNAVQLLNGTAVKPSCAGLD